MYACKQVSILQSLKLYQLMYEPDMLIVCFTFSPSLLLVFVRVLGVSFHLHFLEVTRVLQLPSM